MILVLGIVLTIFWFRKSLTLASAALICALVAYPLTFFGALMSPASVHNYRVFSVFYPDDLAWVLLNAFVWGSVWFALSLIVSRIVYRKKFITANDPIQMNLTGSNSLGNLTELNLLNVICAVCRHTNPPGSQSCSGCGVKFARFAPLPSDSN